MIVKQRIQRADGTIKYREYLKQERLGKGGFAECFVAERIDDKKRYALKVIPKKLLEKPKAKQKMLSEIKLHRGAKHRNICELQRAFQDQQNVYMLLELCTNGNMFQLIRRRKKLTIPETQYFIYQLIDGLCYLHNRSMIHRDVKLGNLLIDKNMNLKLADFGLTTKLQFVGDRKHTVCGTPNYIAPEIIRSSMGLGASGHSYQVDVWSTGVIMYLMLIGKAPFETSMVEKTYQRISKGQFGFPESFKDNDAKDLLKKILVVDPSKRFTFEEILAHPFMNPKCGIPKELPLISLHQIPKLGVFEKYVQDPVKQSARNASIMTLRSSFDNSLDQDFDGMNASKFQGSNAETSRSKDSKVFKQVFSTSNLHQTLKRLDELNRSTSQNKIVRFQNTSRSRIIHGTTSRSTNKLNISEGFDRSSQKNTNHSLRMKQPETNPQSSHSLKARQLTYIYILMYRQQVLWNYLLSNGYSGTYEGNCKFLYNKTQNIYFEIENEREIKMLKKSDEVANERLNNRKKFLKSYETHPLICEPFLNKNRLVYICKIYKVKPQKLILFRLSNGHIQAHQYERNINLLITDEDLVLIEIENGRQISKISARKDDYMKLPESASQIYLKVRKIMNKVNSNAQLKNVQSQQSEIKKSTVSTPINSNMMANPRLKVRS